MSVLPDTKSKTTSNVPVTVVSTLYPAACRVLIRTPRILLITSFYRTGNRDTDRLSSLMNIRELVSSKT